MHILVTFIFFVQFKASLNVLEIYSHPRNDHVYWFSLVCNFIECPKYSVLIQSDLIYNLILVQFRASLNVLYIQSYTKSGLLYFITLVQFFIECSRNSFLSPKLSRLLVQFSLVQSFIECPGYLVLTQTDSIFNLILDQFRASLNVL